MKVSVYDLGSEASHELATASQDVYGSFSYAAGYMQSMIPSMLAKMKKKDAMEFVKQMNDAVEKMRQRELAHKNYE